MEFHQERKGLQPKAGVNLSRVSCSDGWEGGLSSLGRGTPGECPREKMLYLKLRVYSPFVWVEGKTDPLLREKPTLPKVSELTSCIPGGLA